MAAFTALIRHELRLALRQAGDTGLVLGFFVLAVVLFPFGVGPEPAVLERVGAGILWVAALLAALLSLDRLYLPDYEDGGLELLALSRLDGHRPGSAGARARPPCVRGRRPAA